jgi:molecular chaperone DnaK
MSAFGIDFGTTNSAAAELLGANFQLFGYGQKPLPSIVAIDKATGKAKAGPEVREHQLEYELSGNFHVVRSVKTILDFEQRWQTERGIWTPPMVAAEVLRTLSIQARQFGVESGIRSATFSVPVGVRPSALRVLRDAARLADIKVNGIIKESTAALFRRLDEVRGCRYVVVFDWGGGTLDITVLEIRGDTIYEKYVDGLPHAGEAIDENIARRVHPYLAPAGKSFDEMPESERDALRVHCEIAKCHLATNNETNISLVEYGGKPQIFAISRDFCRPVIELLVRGAIDLLVNTIRRAGLSVDAIEEIIMVGGSSRLWLLREMIQNDPRFGGIARFPREPEWDVAKGAAIIDQHPGAYSLAETIALELSDGSYFELARPGDTADNSRCSVSLALVEDTRTANVVIDRWHSDTEGRRELACQFGIPTQGFDLEAINLSWRITEDLTVAVEGRSYAHGDGGAEQREITRLRYGYHIGIPVQEQPAASFQPVSEQGALPNALAATD